MSALTRSEFQPYLFPAQSISGASMTVNQVIEKRDTGWVLDNEQIARCATSCLIEPITGDQVMVIQHGNLTTIFAILSRLKDATQASEATLTVPDVHKVTFQCEDLLMQCRQGITFQSAGKIVLQSKHFIQEVKQNIVQIFRGFIAKGEQWNLTTQYLNRMHSRQQMITAEKEIKVDADRINMG